MEIGTAADDRKARKSVFIVTRDSDQGVVQMGLNGRCLKASMESNNGIAIINGGTVKSHEVVKRLFGRSQN